MSTTAASNQTLSAEGLNKTEPMSVEKKRFVSETEWQLLHREVSKTEAAATHREVYVLFTPDG